MRRLTVEVLITTMNMQDPLQLLDCMNISTQAMIGNQTSFNEIVQMQHKDNVVTVFSFNERGVGLNRNNLLMRSKADFCAFGDDDLRYVDNYQEIICNTFHEYPKADVLIFNLDDESGKQYVIKEGFRVNHLNFMRFGAARIVVRREAISMNAISFNQNFGGGTSFSSGEDTFFLYDCLKRGLKIYAVPTVIARLQDNRPSTWFVGYDEKYFRDKGTLYYLMYKKGSALLCMQDAWRHRKMYKMNPFKSYNLMMDGKRKYLKRKE